MRLQNKVALITGGAQGIGRAIALGMGREGAQLVVADLQAEKAETVAAELRALGAEALALDVNVASEQSVQRLAERTFEHFGRVDILVNDAGVYLKAPVVDQDRGRLGSHARRQSRRQLSLRPRLRSRHAPAEKRAHHQHRVFDRP